MKTVIKCLLVKKRTTGRLSVISCCAISLLVLLSFNSSANPNSTDTEINVQQMSKMAPSQTMHYGRLVGNWEIKDQSLGKDGKWVDGPGANWNFYWILGGNAIQDDWISPGYKTPAPEKGRQFGTNIRIFNPKSNQWDMAWIANTGKKVDTFKATSNEQSMVAGGVYNNQPTRISFFDITDKRFSWKMEKQDPKTKEWQAIYKIEGYKMID